MTKHINQEVNVSAYYFSGRDMRSFPRAIEHQGRAVTFVEGLQYVIRRGQSVIQLFDMSAEDGTYRLRKDGASWTLLGMKGAY